MSAGKRFRKAADRLFTLFGEEATLNVPAGPLDYDTSTGDTNVSFLTYPIKIAYVSLATNPLGDYGSSAFKEGSVTFYVTDITVVVDETCFITDLNGVKWGINNLTKVKSSNLVVVYEAVLTAHEGA